MAQTLWTELPPPAKEALLLHAPEWLLKALQGAQCGKACWIPKVGQMPVSEQRRAARARYQALQADGVPYGKRIRTIAAELQVSPRSVQRWLKHE